MCFIYVCFWNYEMDNPIQKSQSVYSTIFWVYTAFAAAAECNSVRVCGISNFFFFGKNRRKTNNNNNKTKQCKKNVENIKMNQNHFFILTQTHSARHIFIYIHIQIYRCVCTHICNKNNHESLYTLSLFICEEQNTVIFFQPYLYLYGRVAHAKHWHAYACVCIMCACACVYFSEYQIFWL